MPRLTKSNKKVRRTKRRYFGTDGIRGLANRPPMTPETAFRLGAAVASRFSREGHRARVLVGKDTRLSGYMFEAALIAGITSMGADVVLLGPLPTPGIAQLTVSMRADAGIVISASHNPFEDNGLKVFGRDGFKLPDATEIALEELMDQDEGNGTAIGRELGRAKRIDDANGRYVTHLKSLLDRDRDLEGMRIVVDCANGAAYKCAPTALRELGADVIALGVNPDGTNINELCGSLHPELAAREVRQRSAHLGITLDGDADRLILIDEKGDIVDGDAVMALCAIDLARDGALAGNTVVATVMSNMGLEKILGENGISLERTKVGDRYVVERMRDGSFNFGGEQSGHLVFLDHATTGDGMVAALQVLNVMLRRGKSLSELASVYRRYPQVLVNQPVGSKPPIEELPSVQRAIKNGEGQLGDDGRILVRYSGTENKARVMVEGTDDAQIRTIAEEIAGAFRREVAPPSTD